MRIHRLAQLLVSLTLVVSTIAAAQVRIEVNVPLPLVRFEAPPPLVEVEPGVQVVENYGEEVFFADGWYWLRTERGWYRSRDHRGHWGYVKGAVVPARLTRIPPGHYKGWKVKKSGHGRGHDKHKG